MEVSVGGMCCSGVCDTAQSEYETLSLVHYGKILLAMAVVVFKVVALIFQRNKLPRSKLRGIKRKKTLPRCEASFGESHPARD
jgi:hypothetical protein